MADLNVKLIFSAVTAQVTGAVEGIKKQLGSLASSALSFGGALAAGFGGVGLASIAKMADNLRLVEGRIKLASDGAADFTANYEQLKKISLETNTALEENANMFARILPGIKQLGGGAGDALVQVDLLAKTLKISGASQSESAAVITQWSQAMASGVVRGDEFNSIMENNPRLSKAMADGLGVNIGELRKMAEAGELSSARVTNAIVSQSQAINTEVAKIPVTMGQAMTNLQTQFMLYVGEIDKSSGATQTLAGWIQNLADSFNGLKIGAMVAIDAIVNAFADFEFAVKKAGLELDLFFTINPAKADVLTSKIKQLEEEFLAAAENRKKAFEGGLDYETNKPKPAAPESTPGGLTQGVDTALSAKEFKAINQAKLDAALVSIKTEQDAAKNAHDVAVAQTESEYKAKELALKQSTDDELVLSAKLIDNTAKLNAAKLEIEKGYLKQSLDLELKANAAKVKAAQEAATATVKTKGSLAGLIAGGESGADAYNSFNRGTSGNKILPALGKENLQALTIAEIQARQALDVADKDRLGAVGKYQVIASTLKAAVAALKLSADTKFDAATQEKIFTDYLLDAKRPSVKQYVTGGSNDINAAIRNLSQEFASIANPDTGKSFYDGKGGNTASINVDQVKQALAAARQSYQQNNNYPKAIASGASSAVDQQASAEQLRALQQERLQAVADYNAKLKLLGIASTNDGIEKATKDLELEKRTTEKEKALLLERAAAEQEAGLTSVDDKATQAARDVQLGIITNEQLLGMEQAFAEQRLAIENTYYERKLALLDKDTEDYRRALKEQEAAKHANAEKLAEIDFKAAQQGQQQTQQAFAPLEQAIDQSVSGVITGQQTLAQAARHSAQSIVLAYVQSMIKKRVIEQAEWAYEVAGFAGVEAKKAAILKHSEKGSLLAWIFKKAHMLQQWAFELLGFKTLEAEKTATTVEGETAQTLAQTTGDQLRVASTAESAAEKTAIKSTEAKKSLLTSAAEAAGEAFTAMADIPIVGPILGAIAAGAAFAGVMAFGSYISARGGDMRVKGDGVPYMLHQDEAVLPAGVADNFRKVVAMVGGKQELDVGGTFGQLAASGAIASRLSLPSYAAGFAHASQSAANDYARDRMHADRTAGGGTHGKAAKTEIHMNGIMLSPETFFERHADTVVKVAAKQARNFNKGKK